MKQRDIVALLVLSAVWGGSFLFMRIAAPVLFCTTIAYLLYFHLIASAGGGSETKRAAQHLY